jgi:ribosomal protein S18 acetylase RimI-like enzyme
VTTVHVRLADGRDVDWLASHERHISRDTVAEKIERGEFLLAELAGDRIGWLRWNYFWDEIPFMNLLYILEPLRGREYGRALVDAWERSMRANGHRRVLTSTLSNERAQHFYRRQGYRDSGALLLPAEALEIIMLKELER